MKRNSCRLRKADILVFLLSLTTSVFALPWDPVITKEDRAKVQKIGLVKAVTDNIDTVGTISREGLGNTFYYAIVEAYTKKLTQMVKDGKEDDELKQLSEIICKNSKVILVGPQSRKTWFYRDKHRLADSLRVLHDAYYASIMPVDQIKKHPSADLCPGIVPDNADRSKKTVPLNIKGIGIISTGLYAPAGEKVAVTLPPELKDTKVQIRIGLSRDRSELYRGKFPIRRMPIVDRVFDVTSPTMTVASAFGGGIYIILPDHPEVETRRAQEKEMSTYRRPEPLYRDLVVDGAVRAPCYIRGIHSPSEWETIKNHPAPYGEFGSDKIILTMPSEHVRKIKDPEAVTKKWDDVMDAIADLAGCRRERPVPMRVFHDAHVVCGVAHTGLPVVAPYWNNWIDTAIDSDPKHIIFMGYTHEIGHMHQRGEWNFQGQTEVVPNILLDYVSETVFGFKEGLDPKMTDYVNDLLKKPLEQRNWADKSSSPKPKHGYYRMIHDELGWKPFFGLFNDMRDNKNKVTGRNKEIGQADIWVRLLSRHAGKNLYPYSVMWGMQLSPELNDELKNLPTWFPQGMCPVSITIDTNEEKATLSTWKSDAKIYYTLDGSKPGPERTLYTAPVPVKSEETISAVSVSSYGTSTVYSAQYISKSKKRK